MGRLARRVPSGMRREHARCPVMPPKRAGNSTALFPATNLVEFLRWATRLCPTDDGSLLGAASFCAVKWEVSAGTGHAVWARLVRREPR